MMKSQKKVLPSQTTKMNQLIMDKAKQDFMRQSNQISR